ncbi:MAG TPA: MBL fold metallo-hydrolase [Longimicrobium sp.]|nr:MBL fold metallo-hydrolase [Longimicrobium sp.]
MEATLPLEAVRGDPEVEVAPDVECLRTGIVNCFLVGLPGAGDRQWVLVDTGMIGFTHSVVRAAAERFGADSRPAAIVMTHGHFDHVGGLRELAEAWDVPVYAHPLELPYLTGESAYPPPDPTVGGGMMARLSPLFPRGPFDVGGRARPLPADGSVPGMPGWRWIFTPGHSPGHVSFFRDEDRVLIAGDAFVTTKQESLLAVLEQRPEIHGPPMYYTTDWNAARDSVRELAALEPEVAATGHGRPLRGEPMRAALHLLASDFDALAVPEDGRYVRAPAISDETGVVSVPPPVRDLFPLLLGLGAAAVLGVAVGVATRRRRDYVPQREWEELDEELEFEFAPEAGWEEQSEEEEIDYSGASHVRR